MSKRQPQRQRKTTVRMIYEVTVVVVPNFDYLFSQWQREKCKKNTNEIKRLYFALFWIGRNTTF